MRILFLGNNYNPISTECLQALLETRIGQVMAGVWDPAGEGLLRTVKNGLRTRGPIFVFRKGVQLLGAKAHCLVQPLGILPSRAATLEGLARQWNIPVRRCGTLRSPEELQLIRRFAPDLVVVAAFSRILKPELLRIPALGCINMHPSLLPKYRGPNPFYWALANGESETGVTVHYVDEGIDSGDIILQRSFRIERDDTEYSLRDKSALIGARLLVEAVGLIRDGLASPQPQNHAEATYFSHPPRGASLL